MYFRVCYSYITVGVGYLSSKAKLRMSRSRISQLLQESKAKPSIGVLIT